MKKLTGQGSVAASMMPSHVYARASPTASPMAAGGRATRRVAVAANPIPS